jgi:CheY-like chemotaxis protein
MRWHLSRAIPVRDEQGQVVRWFGTNTDITDRMEMEEVLKDADRRKDEFLATLAHELRNPLAPIRNALHLMGRVEGDIRGVEADRAMAERQVAHLARLIDDLMDIARISRGKIELRKEAVDLAAVIQRAVESARSSLEERGHSLTVTLPDAPVRLEADQTRLEQVFWNLLNNAAKYTDPAGQIRLTAERSGDEVVVRVRDTGIGIEPEMLSKVFEMFVQAGRRSDRSQGGLGIGLSLVKTLVEMHGGGIEAHSEGPGTGSEFVIRLPVLTGPAEERAGPEREAPRRPDQVRPGLRLLVVDDNVDAARSLARLLTRLHGQDVRVAHDGPSALAEAEAFRPEIILLDIGLPGMDGYEVARRLRCLPEFARTFIVAMTGWGQEEDRRRSHEAGFDRHLVKPVDPEDFERLLAENGDRG